MLTELCRAPEGNLLSTLVERGLPDPPCWLERVEVCDDTDSRLEGELVGG